MLPLGGASSEGKGIFCSAVQRSVGQETSLFLVLLPQLNYMDIASAERAFCCHLLNRKAQVVMRTLFDIYEQRGQFQEMQWVVKTVP